MTDAAIVREALLDVVACARSHHGALRALEALDRLVARLAETERELALQIASLDRAGERRELLEEALRGSLWLEKETRT